MKKTKKHMKKFIIIVTIIVVAILAIILIIKTGNSKKETVQETTTGNTSSTVQMTLEIVSPEEEPKNQKRTYAPAEIKNIFQKGKITYLSLDMLTINKDFQPGITDFFINQNPKVRDIAINKTTKAYNCGAGADKKETTPDVSVAVATVITNMQTWISTTGNGPLTYYFDIEKNTIKTIYQQCLP